MAGDTPGRECPREDLGMRPLIGTKKSSGGTVSDDDSRSPCGRGHCPFPALSVEGHQSVPSRIAVVRVDGTIAGDTPGRECPRDERDWRPPAGVSVDGGGAESLSGGGGALPSPDVAGSLLLVVPARGSPLVGAVNPAGPDGPVGPCETLSPSFYKNLDPFEHSVLDHAGPDGRHVAVGPVGPFRPR